MSTPEQIAKINLTDYRAEIISRVIVPMQATEHLKAGTRQWSAELWRGGELIDDAGWTESLQESARAAETLLIVQERALEKEAEEREMES